MLGALMQLNGSQAKIETINVMRREVVAMRHSQGLVSDTWNLKYEHFAKIKVLVPCVAEQQKIAQILSTADAEVANPLKQFLLFKEFDEQVQQRQLDELPEAVRGNPHVQAYFGAFKLLLDEQRVTTVETTQWVLLAEQTDAIVSQAVREFSINPLNIEAAIRQQLLPLYFMALKALGLGMDQVQALVEQVVQIVRAGTRKA